MTLNFPNAPTNGQIFGGYQYNTAKGVWARANFSAVEASTTNPGIVQLATDAQTIAGTNATRAVSPSALSAFLPGSNGVGLGKAFAPGRGSLDAQGQIFQNNGQQVVGVLSGGVLENTLLPSRLRAGSQPLLVNWDTAVESGFYHGEGLLNSPPGLVGSWLHVTVNATNASFVTQTGTSFFNQNSGQVAVWVRNRIDALWTGWTRLVRHDNSVNWGAKFGPASFNVAYATIWTGGRGGNHDINPNFSTTGIQILTTGQYEAEAYQRGTSSADFVGLALNGDREALATRTQGIWIHDHAAGASNYSISKYIGQLNAGEVLTAGGAAVGGFQYAPNSFTGSFMVKRLN